MSKNVLSKAILIGFSFIELAFTILIYIADKFSIFETMGLKYSSIILCFLFSLLGYRKERGQFVVAGLAATLVADYFLLVRGDNYLIGVISFIFVQAMYFLYISPKHWKISLIIRGSIFVVASLVAGLALKVDDPTAYFALFYFSNLLMNAVDSFLSGKKYLLLGIGLLLFMGCDISVGFFNLSSYITYSSHLIDAIVKFSQLGMWLFYVPSQALIALSIHFKERYE
ncbi:MAG: hypothetical protein MJ238_01140 [Bacilli bacterium]|nr:hypothetical protein [Bacilli bacterium]